jgi:hypothetical protein
MEDWRDTDLLLWQVDVLAETRSPGRRRQAFEAALAKTRQRQEYKRNDAEPCAATTQCSLQSAETGSH